MFCVGCQKFDEFLCADCAESILNRVEQKREGFSFFSMFRYEGIMSEVLMRTKEKNHFGFIPVLADFLDKHLELDKESVVLVPPSTKTAFRKRGFNPTYELARRAGMNASNLLQRKKQTLDQQGLQYQERQVNQQNAFTLQKAGEYLLFDDVVTTGATVREMIRAVEEVGGNVLGVLALCSTSSKGANYE